MFNTNTK